MQSSKAHKAVEDGLESRLREYVLNPIVRVEISHPSVARDNPNSQSNGVDLVLAEADGFVSF